MATILVKNQMGRMLLHATIAVTLLTCITGTDSAESGYTSVVDTTNGPVRGRIFRTVRRNVEYSSFQGIPYAKPPEGPLRFQPPVEIDNWSEVFEAYNQGSVCMQFFGKESSIVGSENCLFLNIYIPRSNATTDNNLKPVFVWIHGGGFYQGSGNTDHGQGPDFLLEEDVVFVSINYRLGPFGFLNLNHKNASGNMALKDQNLVLKWIKKNIAKFGGDPNKITISGQSAGSVCVDYHVLSDMSAGLFNHSIAMSGAALDFFWGIQSSSDAYYQAKTLASKLGAQNENSEEILKTLKSASAEDIIAKAIENPLLPFRPTVERVSDINNQKFLDKCAIDKYNSGDFNKGPHMLGFTSREITVADTLVDYLKLISRSNDILKNASITLNDPVINRFSKIENVFKPIEQAAYVELSTSLSDLLFVTGIDAKQKKLLKHNQHPIYYYRFSYDSNLPDEINKRNEKFNISGVRHADDLQYLFYTSPLQLRHENPGDELTINRYVRLMANFVKYGNPTPIGEQDELLKVNWPDSGLLGLHLEIDKKLTVGLRPIDLGVVINQALGIGSSRPLNACI